MSRDRFYSTKRSSLGITPMCRACHMADSMRLRNAERAKRSSVLASAVARAKAFGCEYVCGRAAFDIAMSVLGSSCMCCGSDTDVEIDHVIPLSKGGAHHPANIQPLCSVCNDRKHARAYDYRTSETLESLNAALSLCDFEVVK